MWIFWIVVLLLLEFGIEIVKNEDNYFSRKVRIIVLIPITIFYIGGACKSTEKYGVRTFCGS